jgi:hypothetical protein
LGDAKKRMLFREVNARIRAINERFGVENGSYEVLCECGTDSCMRRIEVPTAMFAEVRDDQERFVVAPGHERADGERVVEAGATYAVVSVEPALRAPHRLAGLSPSAVIAGAR